MKIDIITLFPKMFTGPFDESIIKKAREKDLIKINIHNLRDWATDKHRTVDDRPYGGGPGMILMIEPIYRALNQVQSGKKAGKVILLSPQGRTFDQGVAKRFSRLEHLILICGHYEGVDERIREHLIDEEISIGDYVLTGGELPAMVVTDTVVRLLPGLFKKTGVTDTESFSWNYDSSHATQTKKKIKVKKDHPVKTALKPKISLLDFPQYTRPEEFQGWKVPEILLSGNHAEIEKWRQKRALAKTKKRRPDLLK